VYPKARHLLARTVVGILSEGLSMEGDALSGEIPGGTT